MWSEPCEPMAGSGPDARPGFSRGGHLDGPAEPGPQRYVEHVALARRMQASQGVRLRVHDPLPSSTLSAAIRRTAPQERRCRLAAFPPAVPPTTTLGSSLVSHPSSDHWPKGEYPSGIGRRIVGDVLFGRGRSIAGGVVPSSGSLTDRDLRALVELVGDGRTDDPGRVMPWAAMDGLMRLIPCEELGFCEQCPPSGAADRPVGLC